MRVLHVIDSFSFGGAERLLAALADATAGGPVTMRAASLVRYTSTRTASLPLLRAAGLDPFSVGVRRLADPLAIPLLRRAITRSGCDVVHTHLGYSTALAPIAARSLGIPSVSTLHHVPTRNVSRRELVKERLSYFGADVGRSPLVFVSDAARRAAVQLNGRTGRDWRVLPNGVDLGRYAVRGPDDPSTMPPDIPVAPDAPVVTIVAALRGPKGHEVALRAWPLVREQVPGAVLVVVGDGPERDELRRRAVEGVILTGERSDVPRILTNSTLAVLPSFTEALPTALIEAAACGVPSVASDVGGIPEIVHHGSTGLLVPPGDAPALAKTITTLLLDHELRRRLGRAARTVAEQRFDLVEWAHRLTELYHEVYSGRRDRGTAGSVRPGHG
ncbi:glycosyltransferase family 4 protein [Pseudonocardia charpentierae]|uniref:Glycosyltransferase family 4 protein n=1 Tax=Pseudonocardia charpentierae TaxID=3075545 RepID=A0ABU2NHT0_9PSEU|nr:glycosyltransferase family 4 protein [Pseudonocardia sp. DSM 45834]MDT0353510.1 glycosyltransferase family 4 protein [Pseudonocardia sp. DSM 45834]